MYSFCLEHHELLQVYRSDNCLAVLKASPGYSWLWLLDDFLLCFIDLSASVWEALFVQSFIVSCPMQALDHTGAQRKEIHAETQLNSSADIPLPGFIHTEWTPGVWAPLEIQRQMRTAHSHENWHQWKNFVKTCLAPKHQMFAALSTWKKLTPFSDDSWDNPKGKCQMQWLLLRAMWFQPRSHYVIWFFLCMAFL